MIAPTFKELEHQGWSAKAGAYDDGFAPVTRQAIRPLLAALGPDLAGRRLLDICCGTGHLAAAATAAGAAVEGIDFAAPMVELARRHHPAVAFRQGDAERLPYGDGAFELATNAFGLLHLAEPDQALREVHRVLVPGGRFAFATWMAPEQGFELHAIIMQAVAAHGTFKVDLPPAPPAFRFAEAAECRTVLQAIGFTDIEASEQVATWRGTDGQALLTLIEKAIVRAPMLIERQTPAARARIEAAIVEAAEARRKGDAIELGFAYRLVSAMRR